MADAPRRPVPTRSTTVDGGEATLSGAREATDGDPLLTLRQPDATASAVAPASESLRIGAELGRGGMGVVLEARQVELHRLVAAKRLLASGSDARRVRRFLAEAVVTARLEHPNIVPVHRLLDEGGIPTLVMKRVDGATWRDLLHPVAGTTPKPLDEHIEILLKVCDAVAFAHAQGVLHRDLKPENIMVGAFGEVLVMDWGCAVMLSGDDAGGLIPRAAEQSAVAGTPAYMAPEMARGDGARLGTWSDVYLLGAMLYEVLTGRQPHRGRGVAAVLAAAGEGVVREPSGSADPELAALAMSALAPDPGSRPQSAQAFAEGLRAWRRHAEALRLVERSRLLLQQTGRNPAARVEDCRRAVAGCEQALELWADSQAARAVLAQARLAAAEAALASGDLAAAAAQAMAAAQCGADAAVCRRIGGEAQRRQGQAAARERQVRKLRRVIAIAAMAVVVALSVGLLLIERQRGFAESARARAEEARSEADRARSEAETARDAARTAEGQARTAEGQTRNELQQRVIAEERLAAQRAERTEERKRMVPVLLSQAQALAHAGAYEPAWVLAGQILEYDPGHTAAGLVAGVSAMMQGKRGEATRFLTAFSVAMDALGEPGRERAAHARTLLAWNAASEAERPRLAETTGAAAVGLGFYAVSATLRKDQASILAAERQRLVPFVQRGEINIVHLEWDASARLDIEVRILRGSLTWMDGASYGRIGLRQESGDTRITDWLPMTRQRDLQQLGLRQIPIDSLACLSHPGLKRLILNGYSATEVRFFQGLVAPELEVLLFSSSKEIQGAVAYVIPPLVLPKLRQLGISGTRQVIVDGKHLQHPLLEQLQISDAQVQQLADMPVLPHLDTLLLAARSALPNCRFATRMPALRNLTLVGAGGGTIPSIGGVQSLDGLQGVPLKQLSLAVSGTVPLDALKGMPLETLTLVVGPTGRPAPDWTALLGVFPQLTSLILCLPPGKSGIEFVNQQPRLTQVLISGLSSEDLAGLRNPSLRRLQVGGANSKCDMSFLRHLRIESLRINPPQFGGSLDVLVGHPTLKTVETTGYSQGNMSTNDFIEFMRTSPKK